MKGSIAQFRALLKKNPVTAALIVPSSRYEICMDLNGDGKADFAFIDSKCDFTGNGGLDTFAIDTGKDGEFDLYLRDSDANFVPDELFYVEDGATGAGIKTGGEYHDLLENTLKASTQKFAADMTAFAAGEKSGEDCKEALQAFVNSTLAELAKLQK